MDRLDRVSAAAESARECRLDLLPHGPGHAIGIAAGIDVADNRKRLEVDDGDVVVGAAGHKGACSVGLDEDAT